MTKLSRKLLISVFTLAFALVTLGATTFAWFTLTSTASVNQIDMQVIAGEGLQISGNGSNWRNNLPLNEVTDLVSSNNLTSTERMDALTTQDGKNFYSLGGYEEVHEAGAGYIEFRLHFRSPSKDARIYFNTGTHTSSTKKTWISDVPFIYRDEELEIHPSNSETSIFAADALRFSFEEYNSAFLVPVEDTMKIFEFDPSEGDEREETDGENLRLNNALDTTRGLVKYWEAKNAPGTKVPGQDTAVIPASIDRDNAVGHSGDEGSEAPNTLLLTASKGDGLDGYYYNYAIIRLWLEGWDPDNFDALLNGRFAIVLSFSVLPKAEVVEP